MLNLTTNTLNFGNIQMTLASSSWSDGTYTINSDYITNTSIQEITLDPSVTVEQYNAFQKAKVIASAQSNGSLTLKSLGIVPTVDIPIVIIFRGDTTTGYTNADTTQY